MQQMDRHYIINWVGELLRRDYGKWYKRETALGAMFILTGKDDMQVVIDLPTINICDKPRGDILARKGETGSIKGSIELTAEEQVSIKQAIADGHKMYRDNIETPLLKDVYRIASTAFEPTLLAKIKTDLASLEDNDNEEARTDREGNSVS